MMTYNTHNRQYVPNPFEEGILEADALQLSYRDLNMLLRKKAVEGFKKIRLYNIHGQRYIGTGLPGAVDIEIFGTPGNDLAAFMEGSKITVYGNVQDCCGNTMNCGQVFVHGRAGDITGYSMRGGKIFIRDDVGYRAGIHMKEYRDVKPLLAIGGTAQDFLGEYQAGGVLILLGLTLTEKLRHRMNFIGTGMHGGAMFIRGTILNAQLSAEAQLATLEERDFILLESVIKEFAGNFKIDIENKIQAGEFCKVVPSSKRPYEGLYSY